MCANPFPGSNPGCLPHPLSLSLALNLLYNFKIKFKKKQERESTEGKYLPQYLSKEEKKVSAYVKRQMQGIAEKSEHRITRKIREKHI